MNERMIELNIHL